MSREGPGSFASTASTRALDSALRKRGLEVFFDSDSAAALGRPRGLPRERLAKDSDLVVVVGGAVGACRG